MINATSNYWRCSLLETNWWGDSFTSLGIECTKPFWNAEEALALSCIPLTPGEYGQSEYLALEIFKRVVTTAVCAPLALISTPIALMGQAMIGLGSCLKSYPYQYVKGSGNEEPWSPRSIFHLNACMMSGSLPLHFGDVMPAGYRLEQLKELIDDDLVLLSEIGSTVSGSLQKMLDCDFAHFYLNAGMNPFGTECNLFVASKVPFISEPSFVPFMQQGEGMQKFAKRGYFRLEFADKVVFFTHLEPHSEEIREKQLEEIKQAYAQIEKPILLIGDLNTEHIIDGFTPVATTDETRADISDPSIPGEMIDHVLCRPEDRFECAVQYIDTYTRAPTPGYSTSLSDHKAMRINIHGASSLFHVPVD